MSAEQVVMVSGATGGIGRATVRALADGGALVVAAGRNQAALDALARAHPGGRVVPVRCDITRSDEVEAAANTAVARFGRLTGAFNNAGVFGATGPLHADTEENLDVVLDTNVRGLWRCMRYQIAAMTAGSGGSIVNCSSVAATRGHPASAVYTASKHAVVGLSRSAALQYAAHGIRVNVVSPGSTDTEMLRRLYPDEAALRRRAQRAPLGRLGRPEEIAAAVVWLLSPAAGYVTGQNLTIDGGVTAGT